MCLFCDIIEGKIPSNKVYEDDKVLCFRDINPVAPTHVLVVPKKHYDDILDISKAEDGAEYLGAVAKPRQIISVTVSVLSTTAVKTADRQ